MGVVWQEQYIKNYNASSFHSGKEMYEAYRKGRLAGFLSSDLSLGTWLAKNNFKPADNPIAEKVLMVAPLYHYVGSEYSVFMTRLSGLLMKQKPFQKLQFVSR